MNVDGPAPQLGNLYLGSDGAGGAYGIDGRLRRVAYGASAWEDGPDGF